MHVDSGVNYAIKYLFMAKNIVNTVQENLGLDPFDKINPNIESENFASEHNSKHFVQAAVTAVLAGLYKYGGTKYGAEELLTLKHPPQILKQLFHNDEEQIVESVSRYGNKPYDQTRLFMERIAQEAVTAVQDETGPHTTLEKIRLYIISQRHNILVYLPPDLQLGTLINDNSIDDRTNKMEGPVSNLMHFFEQLFSEKEKK